MHQVNAYCFEPEAHVCGAPQVVLVVDTKSLGDTSN